MSKPAASTGRPNILWIVTTQWRAQACGYMGDVNARTPQLDAFAAQATNFTEAVTPHPFGPFARAALLTGIPSPHNGVAEYSDPLPVEARTVAHALREFGYVTAFFGKWHLAPRDPAAPLVGDVHAKMVVPDERRGGFEMWEGFEGGFQLNDPWLHGTRLPVPVQFRGYQCEVVCQRAADCMREVDASSSGGPAARPWFCYVSLEPPHPPYDAPCGGVAPRAADAIELRANVPRGGGVEIRARRELAGYYAHIEATDQAIGRLLAAVEQSDTAIIVTSVHGDMHGAHGLFRKGWPHEESVRVPLLVRPPRGSGRARECHSTPRLVTLLDVPRWTLAWARGESAQSADAQAHSLQRISMPSVVRLPHQCDRVWRGGRTAARKLVLGGDGTPWLFFDLERDPGETRNLVADPQRQAELQALREQVLAAEADWTTPAF